MLTYIQCNLNVVPTPLLMLFAYDITDEEIMHGLEPWFDLRNDVVGELSLCTSVLLHCCVASDGSGY